MQQILYYYFNGKGKKHSPTTTLFITAKSMQTKRSQPCNSYEHTNIFT